MRAAYCTLIGNDEYVIGALCLAESYRRLNLPHDFIFLINETVNEQQIDLIYQYNFGIIKIIPNIKYHNDINDNINQKKSFATTTGKFEVFALTKYDKIIFMDADTLLKYPIDILFSYPIWFAAQDPNNKYYNGGTFCITPNKQVYNKIQRIIKTNDFTNDEEVFNYLQLDNNLNYYRKDLLCNNVFHDSPAYGKGDAIPKYWMNDNFSSKNYTLEDIPLLVDTQLQKC